MEAVTFDWTREVARLGASELPIAAAGSRGEIRLGGDDGPVLRPLSFGERTRAVERARHSASPASTLGRLVLHDATVHPGACDDTMQQVVALALARDPVAATLTYAETAWLVARAGAASLESVGGMEAAEVDRLAAGLVESADEWTRVAFVAAGADTLDELRESLAASLLERLEKRAEARIAALADLSRMTACTDDATPGGSALADRFAAPSADDAVAEGDRARLAKHTKSAVESTLFDPSRDNGDRTTTGDAPVVAPASVVPRIPDARSTPALRGEATLRGVAPLTSVPAEPTAHGAYDALERENGRSLRRPPARPAFEREPRRGSPHAFARPAAIELAGAGRATLPIGVLEPRAESAHAVESVDVPQHPSARVSAWPRSPFASLEDIAGTISARASLVDAHSLDFDELADSIARLLERECDLRGLDA